jgi:hypothetical protein
MHCRFNNSTPNKHTEMSLASLVSFMGWSSLSRVATGTARGPSTGPCCSGLTSVPPGPRWPPTNIGSSHNGMVLDFYVMAIAIDYAICYTIGYTIGFQKCYDMSYFICNTCNVHASLYIDTESLSTTTPMRIFQQAGLNSGAVKEATIVSWMFCGVYFTCQFLHTKDGLYHRYSMMLLYQGLV